MWLTCENTDIVRALKSTRLHFASCALAVAVASNPFLFQIYTMPATTQGIYPAKGFVALQLHTE